MHGFYVKDLNRCQAKSILSFKSTVLNWTISTTEPTLSTGYNWRAGMAAGHFFVTGCFDQMLGLEFYEGDRREREC